MVAAKRIDKDRLSRDISRKLLLELKRMKESDVARKPWILLDKVAYKYQRYFRSSDKEQSTRTEIGKKAGLLAKLQPGRAGRELTQPSPRLLAEPCTILTFCQQPRYSVKDLHHDHLVRFVGACVDPDMPYLLTEYCPRGSLQDILEDDDLQLDGNFKHSLIHDIVKVRRTVMNLQGDPSRW